MGMEKMKKVVVIGEKERVNDVMNFLQGKGLFHINKPELSEEIKEKAKPELNQEEENRKQRVLKIIEGTKVFKEYISEDNPANSGTYEPLEDIEVIEKRIARLVEGFKHFGTEKRKIDETKSLYVQYTQLISAFSPLLQKRELPEDWKMIGLLVPRGEKRVVERLKSLLKESFEGKFLIYLTEVRGGGTAGLLVFSPEIEKEVGDIIWQEGLSEIRFPKEIARMGFNDALIYLRKELDHLPEREKDLEERRARFLKENGDFIKKVFYWVQDLADYYNVKESSIFLTGRFFYLESFIPEKFYSEIKKDFENPANGVTGTILLEEPITPDGYEEVPVSLKNRTPFVPFESLIEFFSLPKYGTIDPTPLLSLFFPVYFGFMLGDIAYGAIGLFIFLFIYFKFKQAGMVRNLSIVFISACIWSIIFGFAYGEFFGDIGEYIGLKSFFHRTHNAETFLLYALVFGTIQVSLGLFLSVVNNLKLHHRKHALGSLCMLLGLWSILGLAGVSLGTLPNKLSVFFGSGLALFSILSAIFHGVIAPVEIFSAFAHILSYARLMAIGLSAAILAMIANQFKELVPHILFGFLIMIIFHLLALVLGLFDPTIQGLRLQFVEFFTKFYEPGGKKYSPFIKRLKRR